MKTRVIHVNDMDRYPDAIYIGRANRWKGLHESPFHNPYIIGPDGTRADVIRQYEAMARDQAQRFAAAYIPHLQMLAGKPLACWCRHDGEERTEDNACHGDVICDLIRELGLEPQSCMTDTDTKAVVYAVLATHDELTDVLDSDEFSLHPHFDTPSEAKAFADLFADREVVRVTIEAEKQS